MSDIVNKLWGFCHTLRHDGIDYGDYIEQLTYLLFLKMAEERAAQVPNGCDWASLKEKSGTALTDHYADILRRLREAGGLLGDIFAQATPRFNNPVKLVPQDPNDEPASVLLERIHANRRLLNTSRRNRIRADGKNQKL